jgi:3-oxoacyl-[acyl-carrier-protein] synthase-3
MGIVSCGMYLLELVLTAPEITERSGLPEWVVCDKLGITQKHLAGPDDHPNLIAVRAARNCLARKRHTARGDRRDTVHRRGVEEYLLWTSGIDLANEIGVTRAWAIDIHMRC